jgi:enoyl-CoA hydratase/carnithine racemase
MMSTRRRATAASVGIDNGVALVSLENPPANALSLDLIAERAEDIGAVVIRSSCVRHFAVGADLKLFASLDRGAYVGYLTRVRAMVEMLARLPMPTIAGIDGYAVGGGLELCLACTFRVATTRVRLGFPEVKLGLLPGAGGTQRLTRLVGRARALELLLSGRLVDASEALALGIVTRLAATSASDEALEWAQELAAGPREAISGILACTRAAEEDAPAEGMALEEAVSHMVFETADAKEGIAAFLEKRQPVFGASEAGKE